MGHYHPECPARLTAIDKAISINQLPGLVPYEAPQATYQQLERVHPKSYIADIESSAPSHGVIHLDPDTAMNPYTWDAALRAAGAVVLATDLVIERKVANAFCSVRPPGHHAERNRAMGFCFFNNVAVGIRHALEKHQIEKIAIIDFDVHHGNGTENIFTGDQRVLMVSIFQHPFYPYSGSQNPATNMLNMPLSAGSGGKELREIVNKTWLPALRVFQPQMLFISAGFDAHAEDQLASLEFIEDDYFWLTQQLKEIANQYAEGRIVSVLEGGYALEALGRSAVAHLKALSQA